MAPNLIDIGLAYLKENIIKEETILNINHFYFCVVYLIIMAGIISSPSGIRKRPSNPPLWKRNVMKKARTSGEEYKSIYTGQVIPARCIGQPCKCDKKMFHSYW